MRDFARLLFVGDISLGGDFADHHRGGSAALLEPFVEVHPVFQDADLRIGNLEAPIHTSDTPRKKRNLLSAPPESASVLDYLEFTALSLANNHSTDQGIDGLEKTRAVLKLSGIMPFGAGDSLETACRPSFVQAKELMFAFLGYAVQGLDVGAEVASDTTEGCAPFSLERAENDILAARRKATHVVVSLHWGYQYDRFPHPEQVLTARKIIDLGALIVHGHHPHVLQGLERYGNGLILYSLGNFFFPNFRRTDGQKFRFPRESRRTAAVRCDVDLSGVRSSSVVPLVVDRRGRMHVLHGYEAARAAQALNSLSAPLTSPDYPSHWRAHHRRTRRRRSRKEAGFRVRSEIASMWRRVRAHGVMGSLMALKRRHLQELVSSVARFVRALGPTESR